jgi:hypothetical protein
VDVDLLAQLDDAELKGLGVATVGARKRLRQALEEHRRTGRAVVVHETEE